MNYKIRLPYKNIIKLSIGIFLILFLIKSISSEQLIQSLYRISFPYLLLAFLLQYLSVFLGSFNQYILLIAFSDLKFKYYIISFFRAYSVSLLLPGRFGDASIGFFLKPYGFNYSQSFSAYFLDKYFTFILYLLVFFLFLGNILEHSIVIVILFWLTFAFALPFLIYLIIKYINLLPSFFSENRLINFFHNLISQVNFLFKNHIYLLLINFILTFFKLGLIVLCYHTVIYSLGYSLSVWKVGLAALSAGIVAYIPISIQGLGTVEVTALHSFRTMGVVASDVLICYLLLRTSTYLFACFAYISTFLLTRKPVLIQDGK